MAYCDDAGGRLCTSDELANDCTHATGCNYSEEMIWSSTASCQEMVSTITISTDPDVYAGVPNINVPGYGPLPKSCTENPGDTCTLELCDLD
eukprot:125246_1